MAEFRVDETDRRVAVGYSVAVVLATAAVGLASDPQILGPWSPVWPLLASVVCAAGSAVKPLQRQAPLAAGVRAACWLAVGGWVAWVSEYGVYHGSYWGAWLCGGIALAVLSHQFAMATDFGEPMRAPDGQRQPSAEEVAWSRRIERITGIKDAYDIRVIPWELGGGYTVTGIPGRNGATWRDLQRHEAGFAADLKLPPGCGTTVMPGDHRGAFAMDVSTHDALAEPMEYPA